MKKFIAFILILFSLNCLSVEKVIYGSDDRLDNYQVSNSFYLELARSTAAMIPPTNLTKIGNEYEISSGTLEDTGVCSYALFAEQPAAAYCSGFLVGKNLLVTAGHCITSDYDCSKYKWVFDYQINYPGQTKISIDEDNVYSCKKIVRRALESSTMNDFALIKLDRNVKDRMPLEVREEGKPEINTPLLLVGHPSGLPQKIAGNAWIRNNDNDIYFVANTDSFGGNSGSAVFNAETGKIEGILVRGERDYTYDYDSYCRIPYVIGDSSGRGEDVTYIKNVDL